MIPNILKILTFFSVFFYSQTDAQEVWSEHFIIPERGIWGNENGEISANFSGITSWTIHYSDIQLNDSGDYAKTVSTSGGRFECCGINGELIWYSQKIDISEFKNVNIQLIASETGSGNNETSKYLNAYYILDKGEETCFSIYGKNAGNWGSVEAKQLQLNGNLLQIVVRLNNSYSADKVILDEIIVTGEQEQIPIFKNDILINEILFNPVAGGNDYVELINNSKKPIPINQLYLASRDKNLELTQIYVLSKKRYLFEPENYLVLTKDTNGVFPWFSIYCPSCFLQMEQFPSYNNDEDYVVLLNEKMEIIDEFYYSEKMHTPILADKEGVSLERVSFKKETQDKLNWYSASEFSGYGTPGYKNSQYENEDLLKPKITFSPESFSPNNDNYNDVYTIQYQLNKPGYTCNIRIFDAAGRFVLQLAKNKILGSSGKIEWNGEDETGQLKSIGVYVVAVEIFDFQGNIFRFKDGVVLTNVLE